MAHWTEVNLNSGCTPPADQGKIRLPQGSADPGSKRVLLEAGEGELLLEADYRADGGGGACLAAADFAALGSPTHGRYRPVGWIEAIAQDRGLQVKAAIAALTFIGSIITAMTSLGGSTSWWLTIGFVVALLLASLTFYSDLEGL